MSSIKTMQIEYYEYYFYDDIPLVRQLCTISHKHQYRKKDNSV